MSRPNAIQQMKAALVPQEGDKKLAVMEALIALAVGVMGAAFFACAATSPDSPGNLAVGVGFGLVFAAAAGVYGWASYSCWQRAKAREAQQRAEPQMIEMHNRI